MGFTFRDVNNLAGELKRLSSIRFDAVVKKNMTEIYNRGKAGGTPVRTGELRISLMQSPMDTVGYTKEYAPRVEYGHRTLGGGYVAGQRFLQRNVNTQKPIFEEDLRKQLRRF